MEKIAYSILGLFALVWIVIMIAGLILVFPYGLIGLVVIIGLGLLVIRALKDRLGNKEDDYYSENIHQ